MKFDLTTPKIVKVTMLEYVNEIVESWDKACSELNDGYEVVSGRKSIATAAPDDLFKVMRMRLNLTRQGPRHSTT